MFNVKITCTLINQSRADGLSFLMLSCSKSLDSSRRIEYYNLPLAVKQYAIIFTDRNSTSTGKASLG